MNARRFLFKGLPILLGGIFLAVLFVSVSSANHFSRPDVYTPLAIDQLSSHDDGISFRLNIPDVTVNSDGRIEAEGLDNRFGNPGEPALPYFSKLVILPPGADAELIAEFTSQNDYSSPITYEVAIQMNNYSPGVSQSWFDIRNVNISGTVPLTYLSHGNNELDVGLASGSTSGSVYLNRVTIDYIRLLRAENDELLFNNEYGGPFQFSIDEFQNGQQSKTMIWNISNRLRPVEISSKSISVTGSAGSYTYTFGTSYTTPTKYINNKR